MQQSLEIWENVEVQTFRSSLTKTEYVLRGKRSHLFILTAGTSQLLMDEAVMEIEAQTLIWVPQGSHSRFILNAGARGRSLSIPDLQLGVSLPSGLLGSDIREALQGPIIRRLENDAFVTRNKAFIDSISEELFNNAPAAQNVVRYSLSLLLIEIWRLSSPQAPKSRALPRSIFHNFVSLVELHALDHWTVTDYAKRIGVSKDRLTSAVRRATGRSPLGEIHRKLMKEAEHQLLNSSRQVSEIAYSLGFKDTAYFNRFFNRHAHMPPGKYRAEKQHQLPVGEFSAWP